VGKPPVPPARSPDVDGVQAAPISVSFADQAPELRSAPTRDLRLGVETMAFDLLVWRWANGEEQTDPVEIVEALGEDDPHPAITRFDRGAFESSIRARFGDVNNDPDGPFLYEVSDFQGVPANWISFSVAWSRVDDVCPVVVEIAKSQSLAVFDPQENRILC
jgi:hypothetical protein